MELDETNKSDVKNKRTGIDANPDGVASTVGRAPHPSPG